MGKISAPTPAPTSKAASQPNPTPNFNAEGAKEKASEAMLSQEEIEVDELDVIKLSRKLDVEPGRDRYVRRIIEWSKDKGMNYDDLSDEVRLIQMKIGHVPEDGKAKRVWEYIQLQNQARQAIAKLGALER